MKIVLIAGFSNQEIRNHLDLNRRRWIPYILRFLRIHQSAGELHDYASWVTNIISYFEKREDIELHVIVPHIGIRHRSQSFTLRGVHYHFFSSEYSSIIRKVNNFNIWLKLQNVGLFTKKWLKSINPDLVILSGAENPVTSVSVLYAKDYPRLCLCQVIYNDPERSRYSEPNKLISSLEKSIFEEVPNIGVYCRKHYEILNSIVHAKNIFKFSWPPKDKLIEPSDIEKEYDFVNFALNHSISKGTHDSIRALAIVKQVFPKVTLNIVGGCRPTLRSELDSLIRELDLYDNVFFTPFFENREDLFLHIQKSRFAVLPCKLDNTSGTMTQSMLLGLPIVVYRTPGTEAFNSERTCALIATMEDIQSLSKQMIRLMSDETLSSSLRINGRWYKEKQVEKSAENWSKLVDSFDYIIMNHKTGQPIPQERLFNPQIDD